MCVFFAIIQMYAEYCVMVDVVLGWSANSFAMKVH